MWESSLLCVVAANIATGAVVLGTAPAVTPPVDRVLVARVLGEEIYADQITPAEAEKKRGELSENEFRQWLSASRANMLLYRVCHPVMQDFAARETVQPTNEELDDLIRSIGKEEFAKLDPDDKDAQQQLAIRLFWLRGASYEWRDAKAVHAKYGGRVGISSFGACTAIDGLCAILKERVAEGTLEFFDAEVEQAFWDRVQKNPFTDVVLRPERVPQHFAKSPWQRFREKQLNEAHESADK